MKRKGPWSQSEVDRFLAEARRPVRLACVGAKGYPVLASLWFVPLEGRLWCATQRSARMAVLLERDGRCAFEVAEDQAPYCGVRGQGTASLHPERGEFILRALVDRYLDDPDSDFAQWLLARAASEVAIAIEPERLLSWDFRGRMGASA